MTTTVCVRWYAFVIELFLNDSSKVVASKSALECTYQLTDVTYECELVEVSDAIMSDLNSELLSGNEIPLPYKSFRAHSTGLSGSGTKHLINIAESAINLEAIYSVVQKQSAVAIKSVDTALKSRDLVNNDPHAFFGGRYTISSANTVVGTTNFVKKFNWRYGSTYYPSAPIDLDKDSTLALETALHVFDVKDTPFISNCDEQTVGGFVSRFETSSFMLCHNFKTTSDKMDNGLNSSSSGAPLQLSVEFASDPNAGGIDKEIVTFIQQSNTLYIKQGGASSIISG
jgi:hypothetical protein